MSVDTKILRTNHHRIAQGGLKWHCMAAYNDIISYSSIYRRYAHAKADGSWQCICIIIMGIGIVIDIGIGLIERPQARILASPGMDMSSTVSPSAID